MSVHGKSYEEYRVLTWKQRLQIKNKYVPARSFGKMVEDIDTMSEAIATHASTCAKKLRQQKSYAMSLMVFIHTNNFREDLPQYWKNTIIKLSATYECTL